MRRFRQLFTFEALTAVMLLLLIASVINSVTQSGVISARAPIAVQAAEVASAPDNQPSAEWTAPAHSQPQADVPPTAAQNDEPHTGNEYRLHVNEENE